MLSSLAGCIPRRTVGVVMTGMLNGCLDLDGDGAAGFPCMNEDCDDLNPTAFPGANEVFFQILEPNPASEDPDA